MKLSKQQQRVYDLLKQGRTTAREIIFKCGTNYLSCIIRDLKEKGISINTTPIKGENYEFYELEPEYELKF